MLPSVVTWHILQPKSLLHWQQEENDAWSLSSLDADGFCDEADAALLCEMDTFDLNSAKNGGREFRNGIYFKRDRALVVSSSDHGVERQVLVRQHEQALGHLNNQMQMDRERSESKLAEARARRALKPKAARKLPTQDDKENDRMSQSTTPVKAGGSLKQPHNLLQNEEDATATSKGRTHKKTLFLVFGLVLFLCCVLAGGLLYVRNANLKTKPRRKLPLIC